jgi:hypothetical protein
MKRIIAIPASLFALLAVSGPSGANVATPCNKTSGEAQLTCFCPPGVAPGGAGCRCVRIATDETGIEVY